jgi:heme/copper-type cytochrome/quinol oxidase subunit 2
MLNFYSLVDAGIKGYNKNKSASKYMLAAAPAVVDSFSYGRASTNYQKGFQPAATDVAEGIISFHDDLMFFIVFICIFVFALIFICLSKFSKEVVGPTSERLVHAATLEIV